MEGRERSGNVMRELGENGMKQGASKIMKEDCAGDVRPGPQGPTPSHYVGIGASAGGLEAIEAFFTHMPSGSNMAFIVVQHLSPDYKSLMVELLSKKTPPSGLRQALIQDQVVAVGIDSLGRGRADPYFRPAARGVQEMCEFLLRPGP